MHYAAKGQVSEMSFIYRRGVLANYSKESLCPILAPGGDAQPANLHCRLCGAVEHLHLISDDHADKTLKTHFGLTDLPTGFICASCKNYLKITVGFRAMVEASLSGTICYNKEMFEKADTLTNKSSMHTTILATPTPANTNLAKPKVDILSLLETPKDLKKRKRRPAIAKKSPIIIRKRVITECVQCGHKYPVMVRSDSVLEYVCSRCNQKNQNTEGRDNGTLETQKRCSLRGKTRLNCLSKTPQQVKPNAPSKTRLRSSKTCPKEISPKTTHLRQVHKGGSILASDKKITDNLAGNGTTKNGKYLEQHTKASKRSLLMNATNATHLSKQDKPHPKNVWH